MLCLLGMIKSIEAKLSELGKRQPGKVGEGDNAKSSGTLVN